MTKHSLLFLLLLICNFPSQILALSSDDLLPANQAFVLSSRVENNTLILSWKIAEGYYLYEDKVRISSKATDFNLAPAIFPSATIKNDPYFGNVKTFRGLTNIQYPIIASNKPQQQISVKYQGCADAGVCYPPQTEEIKLDLVNKNLPGLQTASIQTSPVKEPQKAEHDQIALALLNDSLFWTAISFFGFGLLLAFTPCCLPMIPILSGIIVGQGEHLNTSKAFLLSSVYVLASAITYTIFGVLAGLFGSNLQMIFQNPWLISTFSAIFVLLALSMFGLYDLQVPAAIQSRFTAFSNQQKSGSFIGVASMGIFSSLIVGPCIAPPLAGALIYIGNTGDALLGGTALFAMGIGMGAPLLLIGTSAGKLVPKAGTWMNSVKTVFGVLLLGVAVWLISRIVPTSVSLLLWALLLIIPAVYLGAIEALPAGATGWYKLRKGMGVVMLLYGTALFIGVLSGSNDPFTPLQTLANSKSLQQNPATTLEFDRITSVQDLERHLQLAQANEQWLMLDFYADWCTTCIEMEHKTFTDTTVQQHLSSVIRVQADVTKNSNLDKQLLQKFGLIGPPAILFFGPDQQERKNLRTIGFKNVQEFLQNLAYLS